MQIRAMPRASMPAKGLTCKDAIHAEGTATYAREPAKDVARQEGYQIQRRAPSRALAECEPLLAQDKETTGRRRGAGYGRLKR